jgi:Tfp pilus assembly protein PilX
MKSRVGKYDESGAALVLVLIIVTVISLGLLGLLSLSDTSVRTTVGLRDQAAATYAADAAGQVAVDQVRRDAFNGAAGACTTASTTSTEVLSNFYPATSTAPSASAAVRCSPDPSYGTGGGGANSSPGSAILTLGTGAGGEYGMYLNDSNNLSIKVRGGVFSNSNIFLEGNKSDLENTADNSYILAMNGCSSNGTSQIIKKSTTTLNCNYAAQPQSAIDRRGKDPATVPGHGSAFDTPAAPSAVQTPPVCTNNKVYELQPGLYNSVTALNALTNAAACSKSVYHFNPGSYYFDFKDAGSHEWTISGGYLVGGTATSTLRTNPAPTIPGSCVTPGSAAATTSSGVQFVFGGDSRMFSTKSGSDAAHIELCASNAASGSPIAIYGLKQAIGSGATAVSAQSGCVTTSGYTSFGGDSTHCAVVRTDNDPTPQLVIQGTTYTPLAMIDLVLNNNTVQVFRWGLVTRGIRIGSTGSTSSLSQPVIDVPDDAPAPFPEPNVVYLDVFVCPGSATCSATGTPKLRAKVLVSPTPPTTVTVLSWSRP